MSTLKFTQPQSKDKMLLTFLRLRSFFKNNEIKLNNETNKKMDDVKSGLNKMKIPEDNSQNELDTFKLGIGKVLLSTLGITGIITLKFGNFFSQSQVYKKVLWDNYRMINKNIPSLSKFESYVNNLSNAIIENDQKEKENIIEDFCCDIVRIKNEIEGDKYTASYSSNSIFISLNNIEIGQNQKDFGWKFHIAIEESGNNLEKGWNIIKDVLIDNNITSFKINASGDKLKPSQTGKQITIHAFDNPKMDANHWKTLFEEIETKLKKNNIKPAKYNPGDRRVNNCLYITYRNDADKKGDYISAEQASKLFPNNPENRYNPLGYQDLYKDMVLYSTKGTTITYGK